MILTFLGAAHEVTGSCHYIQVGSKKAIVDCGMEQGKDIYENQKLPVNASEIDYIFLTHAHIDHSGLIPLMVKRGFRGKIFATKATCDLCNIMLQDSAHIQESESQWKNRKAKRAGKKQTDPIYTMDDAVAACKMLVPVNYDEVINVCHEISVRFVDAGHLLGSASIKLYLREKNIEKTIIFSGDIGNVNKPIIKDPQIMEGADYALIESTYGDRTHGERADYVGELARILNETFARGGNVVIPSFAVGRTQEMLYFMRILKKENMVPDYPDFHVYVDSPLAVEATTVFRENISECFDEDTMELINRGVNPLQFPGLEVSVTSQDSIAINENPNPKVILSASGMCEAGRIRHHLKHNLWKSDSTILFVGYQTEGTLGRKLLDGADSVKLFGEEIAVNAHIENLKGISGHGDREQLIKWLEGMEQKPHKVFVVHGEDQVCDIFAENLRDNHGYDAYAPYSGTEFDLQKGQIIKEGVPVRINGSPRSKKVKAIYDKLVAAGQRLMDVIKKNEGGANKDLGKFTDEINDLCDKWDR